MIYNNNLRERRFNLKFLILIFFLSFLIPFVSAPLEQKFFEDCVSLTDWTIVAGSNDQWKPGTGGDSGECLAQNVDSETNMTSAAIDLSAGNIQYANLSFDRDNAQLESGDHLKVWVNSSTDGFVLLLDTFNNDAVSEEFNLSASITLSDNVRIKFSCLNTLNNEKCKIDNIDVSAITSDTSPPQWFDNSSNGTRISTPILHSVRWTDESLSGFIFSFDNGTGTLVNDSFVEMTGTSNHSNVTKIINSTKGSTIRWRVYANDSLNQLNSTDIFTYNTTGYGTLQVSIEDPTDGVDVDQNEIFNINATVTCIGDTGDICGKVSALARYNLTANPDTAINVTSGADPFFVQDEVNLVYTGESWSIEAGNVPSGITTNGTFIWHSEIETNDLVYKYEMDGTFTGETWSTPAGFSRGMTTNSTFIWIGDDSADVIYKRNMDGTAVSTFGFTNPYGVTNNGTSMWIVRYSTDEVYKVSMEGVAETNWALHPSHDFATGMGTDNTYLYIADSTNDTIVIYLMDGTFVKTLNMTEINPLSTDVVGITINDGFLWHPDRDDDRVYKYEIIDNPKHILSLNQGEQFNVSWEINVSTATEVSYLIDVFFNSSLGSSLVADNDTDNKQVDLNPSAAGAESNRIVTQGITANTETDDLGDFERNPTESIGLNEISDRLGALLRNLIQALSINEFILKSQLFLVNVFQSLSINELAERTSLLFRTFFESLTLLFGLLSRISLIRNPSEGITLSENIDVESDIIRDLTQSLSINSIVSRFREVPVNIFQSFNINIIIDRTFEGIRNLLQSIIINLTLLAQGPSVTEIFRAITQAININEISERLSDGIRDISDSLSINSITIRFFDGVRGITQAISINEISERFSNLLRNLNQSLNINDVSSPIINRVVFVTQQVNINTSIERFFDGIRDLTQSLNINEVILKFRTLPVNIFQSLSINEITDRVSSLLRNPFTSLNVNDSIDRLLDGIRNLFQTITINLTLLAQGPSVTEIFRAITQAININEISERLFDGIRDISQSFNINVIVDRTSDIFRVVILAINTADVVDRIREVTRLITDSINFQEIIERTASIFRAISQFFSFAFSIFGPPSAEEITPNLEGSGRVPEIIVGEIPPESEDKGNLTAIILIILLFLAILYSVYRERYIKKGRKGFMTLDDNNQEWKNFLRKLGVRISD